jgi:hypothetical protein
MHTFTAAVSLVTPGNQTLTITDTVSGIAGTTVVTVSGGGAAPPPGGGGARPLKPSIISDPALADNLQPGPQVAVRDWFFSLLDPQNSGIEPHPFPSLHVR